MCLWLAGCGESQLDLTYGQAAGMAGETGDTSQAVTAGKCPGANTVQGIDVSVYQGSVNWTSVKNAGRHFGIARVSDGLNHPDSWFSTNWSNMKAAGLIRGAYQFFEPGQDAAAQANMVVAKVGKLGAGDLPVMLDMEVTGGLSPSQITAKIHTWVNTIEAGTGKKPIVYTGAYFWDDYVKSSDFASLPLNVAWYGTNCPGTPNAWGMWTMHQYSSTGSVSGVSGHVDEDVFNGTLAQLQALAGATTPPPSCHRTAGRLSWSCNGPIAGETCVNVHESADPNTWSDNYVCSKEPLGIKWSSAGAIAGMRCTQVTEPSDPHTWTDNYLCVPEVSPYEFKWSYAGPIAGDTCLQWNEPADPNTWSDNYLCWNNAQMSHQSRGPFEWSSAGAVAGKYCTQILEAADKDTWTDNYFCSNTNLGMKWSSAGPIAGMACTHITEGSDPDTWTDNYLCLPQGSSVSFKWSSAGPINPNSNCVAWYEGADPHTWDDNYLCW
ncbi:MAG: GH25 family lysozyme [Myxococcaceae bacterium]